MGIRSLFVFLVLIAALLSCRKPLRYIPLTSTTSAWTPEAGEISPASPGSLLLPTSTFPAEQPVQQIALQGPLAEARAEVSAMAWDGERLILVPQFPGNYASEDNDGQLFSLKKDEILVYLIGKRTQPLEPEPLPLVAPGLAKQIPGFEGFEALAVDGDEVYLTIESSNGQPMMGYLIQGKISRTTNRITLDPATLIPLPPRSKQFNKSDEALVLAGDQLYSIYEANGAGVTTSPTAYRFNLPGLHSVHTVPFPQVEFRITDATPADDQGLFWAINSFWPVDLGVATDVDPLAEQYGEGATHRELLTVERLVEFQVQADRIALTDTPPIQLTLIDDFSARNWEGIARLDNLGFLLMTDEHPASILAFVPFP